MLVVLLFVDPTGGRLCSHGVSTRAKKKIENRTFDETNCSSRTIAEQMWKGRKWQKNHQEPEQEDTSTEMCEVSDPETFHQFERESEQTTVL